MYTVVEQTPPLLERQPEKNFADELMAATSAKVEGPLVAEFEAEGVEVLDAGSLTQRAGRSAATVIEAHVQRPLDLRLHVTNEDGQIACLLDGHALGVHSLSPMECQSTFVLARPAFVFRIPPGP